MSQGKVTIGLMGKDVNFSSTLKKGTKAVKKMGGQMDKTTKKSVTGMTAGFKKLGAAIGAAFLARKAAGFGREFIALYDKQILAETKLAAVLRATGKAAGFSLAELKARASQLQRITTTGDEDILLLQAGLATFTNIKGPQFNRVIELALDMEQLAGSARSAITLLGKALQDPISGLSALSRVGITFTDVQKEQIKNLVETNKLMEAHIVILDILESKLGGVARATALTSEGRRQQAKNRLGDIKEGLGGGLSRAETAFTEQIDNIARSFVGGPSDIEMNATERAVILRGELSRAFKETSKIDPKFASLERGVLQLKGLVNTEFTRAKDIRTRIAEHEATIANPSSNFILGALGPLGEAELKARKELPELKRELENLFDALDEFRRSLIIKRGALEAVSPAFNIKKQAEIDEAEADAAIARFKKREDIQAEKDFRKNQLDVEGRARTFFNRQVLEAVALERKPLDDALQDLGFKPTDPLNKRVDIRGGAEGIGKILGDLFNKIPGIDFKGAAGALGKRLGPKDEGFQARILGLTQLHDTIAQAAASDPLAKEGLKKQDLIINGLKEVKKGAKVVGEAVVEAIANIGFR